MTARPMAWAVWMRGLLPGPLLVAAAVTGPDLYRGAIGGARPGYIQAETRLPTHHGAIGVEIPLLVGPPVAVPDLHPRARGCGVVGDIEALIAVHLQLAVGQRGPLLVGPPVAVPDLQQRA